MSYGGRTLRGLPHNDLLRLAGQLEPHPQKKLERVMKRVTPRALRCEAPLSGLRGCDCIIFSRLSGNASFREFFCSRSKVCRDVQPRRSVANAKHTLCYLWELGWEAACDGATCLVLLTLQHFLRRRRAHGSSITAANDAVLKQ